MGILRKIADRVLGSKSSDDNKQKQEMLRRCYIEVMEERRVLSANPVVAGITYREGDGGLDTQPDYFEVTFEGGSATTQLTQFTLNGDLNSNGVRDFGDIFFDTNGIGAGGYFPFRFDAASSVGITASDILGFEVSEDGLVLTVNLKNFEAGDVFAFTIDVDEMENLRPDMIVSGVEIEGTAFGAVFEDAHYTFTRQQVEIDVQHSENFIQRQWSGTFFDDYDVLFAEGGTRAGGTLDLNPDNWNQQANRTAGAIDVYQLTPKPITIAGTVYHDENANLNFDGSEHGIANVTITLQKLDETTGQYVNVATTTTNDQGAYKFGLELNLKPGTYRLIESQPEDYINVGAVVGSHGGNISQTNDGQPNILTTISIPLGGMHAINYDFAEIKPAALSGYVWHDQNDNGIFDSGEHGIANVLIQVTRVGSPFHHGNDPWGSTSPIFVRTNAEGFYSVEGLPPGVYEIIEINQYPEGQNPLSGYIDGKESIGNVGGVVRGIQHNDRYAQVNLLSGDRGVRYDFGELKSTSISGYVSLTDPNGNCVEIGDSSRQGIGGVRMELYDAAGNLIASTQTNAAGYYEFKDLIPGTYTVFEIQPEDYLDVATKVGTVNGQTTGTKTNNRISDIVLTSGNDGVMYNFCETLPASICGFVYHDRNDNGVRESGEEGIGNVRVVLYDAQGNIVRQTTTNAEGGYCFKDLYPGEYRVVEFQPDGWVDGKDTTGKIDNQTRGQSKNDEHYSIVVKAGEKGTEYNFGEYKLAQVSGYVSLTDPDGNCVDISNPDRMGIVGVRMELYDGSGNLIASTLTNGAGYYEFKDLIPGTYTVVEVQPDAYLDVATKVGTVNGQTNGTKTNNRISDIVLTSGNAGVMYNFCETLPASICGFVYHDRNDNGLRESGEEGIGNVRVVLYDAQGNIVRETMTNAEGGYCFRDLYPGEYRVVEYQPNGWVDGKDTTGKVGNLTRGQSKNDEHFSVIVKSGEKGAEYNFGELKLAQISGYVSLVDQYGNCLDPGDPNRVGISGVRMELYDAQGNLIASTLTNAGGRYEFVGLKPGEYSVVQIQPDQYFSIAQKVGTIAGTKTGTATLNQISGIQLGSEDRGVWYNFCEALPAEIHGRVWEDGPAFRTEDGGLPANYRSLRDGIFDPSVDTPIAGTRMYLYHYVTVSTDDPDVVEFDLRPVTLKDVIGEFYTHMGTSDPNAPVWIDTNTEGLYAFKGLQRGSYIVREEQPVGYYDANNMVGTTTGFTFNSLGSVSAAPQSLLRSFSSEQIMNSIVNIQVQSGGRSLENNFSEVRVERLPAPPDTPIIPPIDTPMPRMPNPIGPGPGVTGFPGLYGAEPTGYGRYVGPADRVAFQRASAAVDSPYTWHLSVVNGGDPRHQNDGLEINSAWQQVGFIHNNDWNRFDMNRATWMFADSIEKHKFTVSDLSSRFGMVDGIPLSGDFNGDGKDEIAVFKDGYWMIDINGNGIWDDQDLLIKFGDAEDRPVVGDWDGDGKDDIGIYGPMWENDPEVIAQEPGLPNPDNQTTSRPKNVPPNEHDATSRARVMKLSTYGKQRADVVDHVFGIGDGSIVPVAGDWNGSGIRSIGTFKDGHWHLDLNGDGKLDYRDARFKFGESGDIPMVGDFNGDGIDEIAVYRSGIWVIDSNGNRELDATDLTFELGGAGDKPVVGDWTGDGVDKPAVYRQDSHVAW